MLVYYFGSKDELVGAIAATGADGLAAAMPTVDPDRPPASARAWLDKCWALLSEPELRPGLALMFELDSLGIRAAGALRDAARLVSSRWIEMVDEALTALGVPAARREGGFAELVAGAIVGILLEQLVGEGDRSGPAVAELAGIIDAARA
jgi:AcrR family transcriptional regulator